MDVVKNEMPVADYCQGLDQRTITVNRNYQRSDRVWPSAAKSLFIETILLGYPIPKLSLHQITDLRTRTTRKEVVDGQQRSVALQEFFGDELRLSTALALADAKGKTYSQLPDGLQNAFLQYPLDIDLLVSAGSDEVREVFRRINSYTVPLNAEESRHASHQGPFKWFIHRLTRDFGEQFLSMGVFTEKQLVRMADAKLLTEVTHALLFGITTTNKSVLNRIYRSRDVEFAEEPELDERIRSALALLAETVDLHETELMKPFQFYSLLLAVIHFQRPVPALEADAPTDGRREWSADLAIPNLTTLAGAAEADDRDGPLGAFVRASDSKTNVADQRRVRFQHMYRAIVGTLPE